MPLKPEDLDDARKMLRAAGHDATAFSFKHVAHPRLGCATGPPLAEVTVTDPASGKARTYPLGGTTKWLARFSRDVAEDFFRA